MEVLMRTIIRSFLVLSLTLVFGASISYAQAGTRIEADIPFDFTIGDKTFAAGKYDLSLFRLYGSVHSVRLRDAEGRLILNTVAIQNGSTVRNKSDMVFSIVEDQHLLDKIRTPDSGFVFNKSTRDKRVAKARSVAIPTSGSAPELE
jgi:hypothetical protein